MDFNESYYILYFICIVVIIGILLLIFTFRGSKPPGITREWVVILPMWGLCNRLRTIRVAYDLAKSLGRKLAVIDDDTKFKDMFDGKLSELFYSPNITFWKKSDFRDNHKISYNESNGGCNLDMSLTDFRNMDNQTNIYIYSCGLSVPGLNESTSFYKSLSPLNSVYQHINPILSVIQKGGVIGVHIRQGSIPDYRKGYFFGKWEDEGDDKLPIHCCSRDKDKNISSCPTNAPIIEKFIESMKRKPKSTKFFVCSDRPGCFDWLEEEFPDRILHNPISIEHTSSGFTAFSDWYCLSMCDKLIVSRVSSFSSEASKMRNVSVEVIS